MRAVCCYKLVLWTWRDIACSSWACAARCSVFYEICYVCSEENAYVLHNEALNPDFRGLYFSADSSFASLYIYIYITLLSL